MKFPITRENLQWYDGEKITLESYKNEFDKAINNTVKEICYEFERAFIRTWEDKRYIYNNSHRLSNIAVYDEKGYGVNRNEQMRIVMKVLIERLQELFVDCNIFTDPLNTYIVIDWSY